MSASDAVAVLWAGGGRARLVHAVHRLGCGADLRSCLHETVLVDQRSVRLVIGKPARTVEDRKPTVLRVFVNAHARLDEVAPVALLGDLQHATLVANRVVPPDHALLLDAQDVVERSDVGHEGCALLGGRDRGGRYAAGCRQSRASGWPPRSR